MVIIMNPDATAENIKDVIEMIQDAGLSAKVMEGSQQRIVGVIGDKTRLASCAIDALPGVERGVSISKSYKLASREFHPQSSVIDVDGVPIGGDEFIVMAGPCAVESREQLFEAAEIAKKGGAQFLRGGAFSGEDPNPLYLAYREAAKLAGVRRVVEKGDCPCVGITEHPAEEGSTVIVAVNHEPRAVECPVSICGRIGRVWLGAPVDGALALPPHGIAVFEVAEIFPNRKTET